MRKYEVDGDIKRVLHDRESGWQSFDLLEEEQCPFMCLSRGSQHRKLMCLP